MKPCVRASGALTKAGYGQKWVGGKNFLAHRLAYEQHVGKIPDGYEVDHLCRNRWCVEPSHLEAVTGEENRRREAAAITHCPSGHRYDGDNLYVTPKGHRKCRACRRESMANRPSRAA